LPLWILITQKYAAIICSAWMPVQYVGKTVLHIGCRLDYAVNATNVVFLKAFGQKDGYGIGGEISCGLAF
jgi:hypothetical protein